MQRHYTLPQACAAFGIPLDTLRRWARSNKLRFVKSGSRYMVTEKDVLEAAKQHGRAQ
jgi:excisionase family DNA binding protein